MGGGGGGYFDGGPPSRQPQPSEAAANPSRDGDPQPTPPAGRPPVKGSGGGGGPGGGTDPCGIRESGILRSPDPSVVRRLRLGDELDVIVQDVSGVYVLVAVAPDGSVVGAIDCRSEQQLVECIEQGNAYAARIDTLSGGVVAVGIRRTAAP